jgi:putative membrane protein
MIAISAAALGYGFAYQAAARAGRAIPAEWRVTSYFAGLAALGFGLLGPLDEWSDVLFSAHMAQHLLITLVAPPLIVLGQPSRVLLRGLPAVARRTLLRRTIGRPGVVRALGGLSHPLSLALAANGSMLFWHLPPLYSAALRNELVHELEHGCFFASGLLFWWMLAGPELPRAHRLSSTTALVLLFSTWMAGDLLGATLTLSSTLLYPDYALTPKPASLTALDDQRLGGLVMWVGAGLLYAAVMVGWLAWPYWRPLRERRAGARTRRRPDPGARQIRSVSSLGVAGE